MKVVLLGLYGKWKVHRWTIVGQTIRVEFIDLDDYNRSQSKKID